MRVNSTSKIELELAFVVTEVEARALEAMAGYGDDAFIKVFYEKLGEHYMRDHEAGLRSFLKNCRDTIPQHLGKIDRARKAFENKEQKASTA